MNIEEVRDYALTLPGVTEDQAFGDDILLFRIEGKIFMCLWLGGGQHDLRNSAPGFACKLPPDRNIDLRERYAGITPAWHWNKTHWSDIYYEAMDANLVTSLIQEAYALVVSKLPRSLKQKYL